MYYLTKTTGSAIAIAIRNSLQKHTIDIRNCHGQAYDTTASMSSDKKGVQAELAKDAPDAEYQGTLLPSCDQPFYMPCLQNKFNLEHDGFLP